MFKFFSICNGGRKFPSFQHDPEPALCQAFGPTRAGAFSLNQEFARYPPTLIRQSGCAAAPASNCSKAHTARVNYSCLPEQAGQALSLLQNQTKETGLAAQ
jgi:hypothetical protein